METPALIVAAALLIGLGAAGVRAWRTGNGPGARSYFGLFAVVTGLVAAGVAADEWRGRRTALRHLAEAEAGLRIAPDAFARVMMEDARAAAAAEVEERTARLAVAGGVAGSCLLFVIGLLAAVVAVGPQEQSSPQRHKGHKEKAEVTE